MINASAKLAAAGVVPVGAGGMRPQGRRGRSMMDSARRMLRRLDQGAQGYLGALAEARNHDYRHWSCSCQWQH